MMDVCVCKKMIGAVDPPILFSLTTASGQKLDLDDKHALID